MRVKAANLLSTFFGCGLSPVAPGTAGSAAALVLGIILHEHHGATAWFFLTLALVFSLPAIWAAGVTAGALGVKDPNRVVVDEVVGQWLAMAGIRSFDWIGYLGAFLLFRLFDIWKPAPVRQLESLRGGVGIVADDLMAGAYAALVLLLAGWFNLY